MRIFPLLLATAAALGGSEAGWRQPLFVIERNTNANVVHYDANLRPDGQIDPHRPIQAYWIMAAQDGRREELTALERSRAYGFSVEPETNLQSFHLELVAQKGRPIEVRREGDSVRAETTIDGHSAYLVRIYVTAGRLRVKAIDYFGIVPNTGEAVHERVQP